MERKSEGNARSDESEGEDRREQGRTQTKHEWDGMSAGDDRDRPQMAGDDTNDSQHLSHESASCHKTHKISNSHQCKYAVRRQVHLCFTWSEYRRLGDISLGSREQCAFNWRRIQTPIGMVTEPLDDQCQLE